MSSIQRLAEKYNVSVDELLVPTAFSECYWIYKVNDKSYTRGEKCRRLTNNQNHVFCQKHHKLAIAFVSDTHIASTDTIDYYRLYLSHIGIVTVTTLLKEIRIKMIQGDTSKLGSLVQTLMINI